MTITTQRGTLGYQEDRLVFDQGTLARSQHPLPGPIGLNVVPGIHMQVKSALPALNMVLKVNPKSQISAQEWDKKIQSSKLIPGFIQKQIKSKNDEIFVTNPKKFSIPNNTLPRTWLNDWLSAFVGNEWEITTGCLDFTVTKGDASGPILTVVHNPDLSSGESVDGFTKHTMTATARSMKDLVIEKGNTLPTGVTLSSGRKLIVIANRIALKLGNKVTMFTFDDDELLNVLFHETACHAGRNTQGLSDTHGEAVVDQCAKDIDGEFNSPRTTLPKIVNAINAFLKP